MRKRRFHPHYIIWMALLFLMLLSGVALLIGGMLTPDLPSRTLMLPLIARWVPHG